MFTSGCLCSDFAVFEKSNPSETPVSHQKSANSIVLPARASAGFGFLGTNKMNHAMKNNPLKISSTSYEVKTPLDSNCKNISDKFQPPGRSAAPRLC
jgi:hypothetical protein